MSSIGDSLTNDDQTSRYCELTAGGRGAICVLAVRGEQVPSRLDSFFEAANGKTLSSQTEMRPVYGRWGNEDIIACVRDQSYVEVHCHGGDFAKRRIMADLTAAGFSESGLDDFRLSLPIGKTAAEAVTELARATTQKTAAILTWQTQGALDHAIVEIEKLAESPEASDKEKALQRIEELFRFSKLGRHLTKPWTIAVAGAANAGKSSLINQIVGYGRSIVMDMPGTTRDLVSVEAAINGWPVELIDTAGLRQSDDPIERSGVTLAEQTIHEADLTIHVIDSSNPDSNLMTNLQSHHTLSVWNKCDLAPPPADSHPNQIVALTGEGVPELLQSIVNFLVDVEPPFGQAVPFLESHIDYLERIKKRLLP